MEENNYFKWEKIIDFCPLDLSRSWLEKTKRVSRIVTSSQRVVVWNFGVFCSHSVVRFCVEVWGGFNFSHTTVIIELRKKG